MEDLGKAISMPGEKYMLGGGNPAHIDEINKLWRKRMVEILENGTEFEEMFANYDTPQGNEEFLVELAAFLNRKYGWPVTKENIAVTNGSQSAMFMLFNILSGTSTQGKFKKILFPLMPEYIGYADQSLDDDSFVTYRPTIEEIEGGFFKYHVDFENLKVDSEVGAICVSRPTNPTGNVLTENEVEKLAAIAKEAGIPLILDNAYGHPFPGIIFNEMRPYYDENTIYVMSLSKLGLPNTRTGIVIGDKKYIDPLMQASAVLSLSTGSIGQRMVLPLLKDDSIETLSKNVVMPFYKTKSDKAIEYWKKSIPAKIDYRIHLNEGTMFLWIWFKNLSITTYELYEKLKEKNVVVVPGQYFFFGLSESWDHTHECIRLNVSQGDETVRRGIEIIGEVLEEVETI